MPGTKSRTRRRKKRQPPVRKVAAPVSVTSGPSVSTASSSTPSVSTTQATATTATATERNTASSTSVVTATAKKLCKSPYVSLPETSSEESEIKMYGEFEGRE